MSARIRPLCYRLVPAHSNRCEFQSCAATYREPSGLAPVPLTSFIYSVLCCLSFWFNGGGSFISFPSEISFNFCPVHLTAFDPSRISKKKIALAKFVSSKNHWWKREEVLCVHRCQIVKFIFDFLNKNISAPSEKFDHWPHFIWLDRFILNLILIN